MKELDFTIRQLGPVNLDEFRSIRLEALKNFPEAYFDEFLMVKFLK